VVEAREVEEVEEAAVVAVVAATTDNLSRHVERKSFL
jgi:hypothetical protein